MIGVDIINLERFRKILKSRKHKFLRKYLKKDEIALIRNSSTAAGFFAAKEAISKALKTGISKDLSFFDIEITKDQRGAPHFKLKNSIIQKHKIKNTSLSISHDSDVVVAVALVIH